MRDCVDETPDYVESYVFVQIKVMCTFNIQGSKVKFRKIRLRHVKTLTQMKQLVG